MRRLYHQGLLLAGKVQQIATTPALVLAAFSDPGVSLRREVHMVGAGAAVEITGAAAFSHCIVVATIGWQLEQLSHDGLPLAAVRANPGAIDLVCDQMSHFVWHGLQ
jgi:hypothetical protein